MCHEKKRSRAVFTGDAGRYRRAGGFAALVGRSSGNKTTLTWGIWDIYDAQLRTPSGHYDSSDPYAADMALVIDYRRNISKKRLLEATDRQWQHLQVTPYNRTRWIRQLGLLWPAVHKGDRLVFMLTRSGGEFYFGNQLLGRVNDPALARSFLAIWLSNDTSYPKLRRQLIGQ